MQKGGWTLNSKLKDAGMDELFRGILALDSLEECYNFFEDLCTINELRAMEQRFEVARMLDRGQIYSDIVRETGASTATISRVNKCLTYGTDGYRTVLDRLKEQEG
jgi:TrpR-related protein YerC/YecD